MIDHLGSQHNRNDTWLRQCYDQRVCIAGHHFIYLESVKSLSCAKNPPPREEKHGAFEMTPDGKGKHRPEIYLRLAIFW